MNGHVCVICICVHVCMSTRVCVCVSMCKCLCMCACVYECVCECMQVQVYVNVHMCSYVHAPMCTYGYVPILFPAFPLYFGAHIYVSRYQKVLEIKGLGLTIFYHSLSPVLAKHTLTAWFCLVHWSRCCLHSLEPCYL